MNWYFKVLKKYATFEGRARRKEYWYFKLFHNLIIYGMILYGLWSALSNDLQNSDSFQVFFTALPPLFWLYFLVTFIPNLAVSVRRLHDINRSAEYLLLWFFAPIGPLVLFIFHAMPGTSGENEFGLDPLTTPDDAPSSRGKKRRRRPGQETSRPQRQQQYRPSDYDAPPPRRRQQAYDAPPPRHRQQDYDTYRHAPHDDEYGDDGYDYHDDENDFNPVPYTQAPRRRPRKRAALYGLDEPASNEGAGYQDPFKTHLNSQLELSKDQMARFGIIDDEPQPDKGAFENTGSQDNEADPYLSEQQHSKHKNPHF